jgi:hypothetical protein
MELVRDWWSIRMDQHFPEPMRSQYGFMGLIEGHPMLAMFFYPTIGCEMCMLGWPISHPKSSPDQRKVLIDLVVARIEREAKNMGYKFISSYPGAEVVTKHFERNGYVVGEVCTSVHKKL